MKLRNLLLFVAAVACVQPAAGQMLTEEARQGVLAAVAKHIKETAYVGGVDFSKWDELVVKHADEFSKANTHDAFARAVNGAFDEFDFSHLRLLTPRSARTRQTGKSVGIGILIEPTSEGLRVIRVIPGGAAEKAGLKVGDLITKGDGKPVTEAEQLRGEKGTKVRLNIRRADGSEIELTITRTEFSLVEKPELKWVDAKTALIKIQSFATGYEPAAIDVLFKDAERAERMIIDLRSNSGGAVPKLGHLAGKVLPWGAGLGKFITRSDANAYLKENAGATDDPVKVAEKFGFPLRAMGRRSGQPFQGDLVVLINGGSASASEIFASAIRDHHRGKIVGAVTAGAVLASAFVELPEKFSLQIPLMEYVTQGGKRLEGAGVPPDVIVNRNQIGNDEVVLRTALNALDSLKDAAESGSKPPPGEPKAA